MANAYEAVSSLYSSEASNLRRRLARQIDNDHEAEDLVQDAYLRLLSGGVQMAELRSPKAFLFTVASNLAVDRIRSQQRMHRLLAEQHDFEVAFEGDELHLVCPRRAVEDQVDAELRLRDVLDALQALPAKCRSAFVLHKFHELSYAEVAQRLGVTVSMVEKHLSSALAHLRGYPELFED